MVYIIYFNLFMLSKMNKAKMLGSNLFKMQNRSFAAQGILTKELEEHLNRMGFTQTHRVVHNPT